MAYSKLPDYEGDIVFQLEQHRNRPEAMSVLMEQPAVETDDKGRLISHDFADLCDFECPVCHEGFSSANSFGQHATAHHKDMNLVSVHHITKRVFHPCRVCGRGLHCDRRIIYNHVRSHDVAMDEYQKMPKFNGSMRKKTEILPPSQLNVIEKDDGSKVCNDVGNACKFQCPTCKNTFRNSVALKTHSKGECEYRGLEASLLDRVYHQCRKCGRSVICDTKLIICHVKTAHNMKMARYRKMPAYSGLNVKRQPSVNGKKKEISLYDPEESGVTQDGLASVGIYECSKIYKCPSCDFTTATYRTLRYHFKENQGCLSAEERRCRSRIRHICRMCGDNLPAHLTAVKDHVDNEHELSLKIYINLPEYQGPTVKYEEGDDNWSDDDDDDDLDSDLEEDDDDVTGKSSDSTG